MMAAAAQLKNQQQQEAVGTILWLTGWSMPKTVFDRLREQLPDFHHIFADYKEADSPEKMLMLTESAVEPVDPPAGRQAPSARASTPARAPHRRSARSESSSRGAVRRCGLR